MFIASVRPSVWLFETKIWSFETKIWRWCRQLHGSGPGKLISAPRSTSSILPHHSFETTAGRGRNQHMRDQKFQNFEPPCHNFNPNGMSWGSYRINYFTANTSSNISIEAPLIISTVAVITNITTTRWWYQGASLASFFCFWSYWILLLKSKHLMGLLTIQDQ